MLAGDTDPANMTANEVIAEFNKLMLFLGMKTGKFRPMARPDEGGTKGRPVNLIINWFNVRYLSINQLINLKQLADDHVEPTDLSIRRGNVLHSTGRSGSTD